MRVGHESRTETQFDVTDPLALRVLHVFPGHAATGVIISQHGGHPFELGEELDQSGLRRAYDDVRAQFVQRVAGKRNPVEATEVENGLKAHAAVEMAVQIDERRASGHERTRIRFPRAGDKRNCQRATSLKASGTSENAYR